MLLVGAKVRLVHNGVTDEFDAFHCLYALTKRDPKVVLILWRLQIRRENQPVFGVVERRRCLDPVSFRGGAADAECRFADACKVVLVVCIRWAHCPRGRPPGESPRPHGFAWHSVAEDERIS